MNNSIQIDNIGCLYTANENGVQSYENTSLIIENGLISSIGDSCEINSINCNGKMVTAGFVDSHTHPVFLNNREKLLWFEKKAAVNRGVSLKMSLLLLLALALS